MPDGPAGDAGPLLAAAVAQDPLQAALAYAAAGWTPLPLCPPSCPNGMSARHVAGCASPGKTALVRWAAILAPPPATIRAWWRTWPGANLAVRTGPEAGGLLVLDLDVRHDGLTSLGRLLADLAPQPLDDETPLPDLPVAALVVTGGGGWHYYMRHPDGLQIGSRSLAFGPSYPGLDVKAAGGYVVAPPSIHAAGETYRWLRAATSTEPVLDETPAWLARALTAPRSVRTPPTDSPSQHRPARRVYADNDREPLDRLARRVAGDIDAVLDDLRRAPDGARNNALNYAAWRIGHLVYLHPELGLEHPRHWAGSSPVDELVGIAVSLPGAQAFPVKAAEATARSGYASGVAGENKSAAARTPRRKDVA